jgi:crotonobetainyl-CoA:carnitine CoA-transferase CaiB-like acyl-CoA transferase
MRAATNRAAGGPHLSERNPLIISPPIATKDPLASTTTIGWVEKFYSVCSPLPTYLFAINHPYFRCSGAAWIRGKYPRLIYCSISGYGFTGPKAEQPGYDILAQAEAGVMSFTGEPDGGPLRFPIAIADMTTGMYSAMGILAALFARERSGKGDYLDMALFDSQLTWLANVGSSYLNAGVSPRRWGNAHPNIVPYQLFRGNDGRYFVVGVGTQEQWRRLVRILEAEELGNDMRFANNAARNENREHLIPLLQRYFERFESAAWLARLKEADIPVAPIQTVGEALGDAQTLARGLVVELEHPTLRVAKSIANPIRLSEQPIVYRLPPPLLGEHSRSILRELQYSETDVGEVLKEACHGADWSKHDTK